MQGVRRQLKNVAYNYSDAQKKVREATSNSPNGPSQHQMREVADYMRNPIAFNEVMSIMWKRLNDSGRNWRHVYKSLLLVEYLVRCGNERVAVLCRENIFAITTLRDFQHVEDGVDQGILVREKAREIATILNGDITVQPGLQDTYEIPERRRVEQAVEAVEVPASRGEEELQLRMALQLSMQEQEQSNSSNQQYEVMLKQALEESMRESEQAKANLVGLGIVDPSPPRNTRSAVDDLLSLGDMNTPQNATSSNNWANVLQDPWNGSTYPTPQSVHESPQVNARPIDPWSPLPANPMGYDMPPSAMTSLVPQSQPPSVLLQYPSTVAPQPPSAMSIAGAAPFSENGYSYAQPPDYVSQNAMNQRATNSFLGVDANVANLDSLIGLDNLSNTNPFMQAPKKTPTINEIRNQQSSYPTPPLSPYSNNQSISAQPIPTSNNNPFASAW